MSENSSNDTRALTSVRRYVCFGGNGGKAGGRFFNVRGRILPIVFLSDFLGFVESFFEPFEFLAFLDGFSFFFVSSSDESDGRKAGGGDGASPGRRVITDGGLST